MHSAGIQPSHLRVLALCFSAFAPLSDAESGLLRDLAGAACFYPPFRDVHAAGVPPPPRMIVAGWAAQYRRLANGQRQIISLRLPGDVVGPMDQRPLPSPHAVAALTELETVDAQPLVDALAGPDHPSLAHAVRAMAHLDAMLLGDQVMRLGRQSPVERLAHLMLELDERLGRVGLADGRCFAMPLAPEVLADVLGCSVVHVNRAVQQLRRDGLLDMRDGTVTLLRRERLQAMASRMPLAGLATRQEVVPKLASRVRRADGMGQKASSCPAVRFPRT